MKQIDAIAITLMKSGWEAVEMHEQYHDGEYPGLLGEIKATLYSIKMTAEEMMDSVSLDIGLALLALTGKIDEELNIC